LRALFIASVAAPEARAILDPGITWGSFAVPVPFQVAIVALSALALLFAAVKLFSRTE
jgi:hypothetical protein